MQSGHKNFAGTSGISNLNHLSPICQNKVSRRVSAELFGHISMREAQLAFGSSDLQQLRSPFDIALSLALGLFLLLVCVCIRTIQSRTAPPH